MKKKYTTDRYKVLLFDKDGYLKKAEWFTSELLAVASGKNWAMLTKGNTYTITKFGA